MGHRPLVPELQVPYVEAVGQRNRLIDQGGRGRVVVGQHPAHVQIGQAHQEPAEQPAADVLQRQDADGLPPANRLEAVGLVLQAPLEDQQPTGMPTQRPLALAGHVSGQAGQTLGDLGAAKRANFDLGARHGIVSARLRGGTPFCVAQAFTPGTETVHVLRSPGVYAWDRNGPRFA